MNGWTATKWHSIFVFCELFEEVVAMISTRLYGAWMPVADDQNFHVSG